MFARFFVVPIYFFDSVFRLNTHKHEIITEKKTNKSTGTVNDCGNFGRVRT